MQGLLGSFPYERAYYHCPHCAQLRRQDPQAARGGFAPTDAMFALEHGETPAASQALCLIGLHCAFEEGSEKLLHQLTGLRSSASKIRDVTERVGQDLQQRRSAGETFGPPQTWSWNKDQSGQSVAYVSLDATSVPQQGPHGEKRDGRMPVVGAVYNAPPPPRPSDHAATSGRRCSARPASPATTRRRGHEIKQRRYVCGLMSLPEIGAQLKRECQAVGVDKADVVIGLTDGGAGLEDCLLDNVLAGLARRPVFILDFHHVSDHLEAMARQLHSHDDKARKDLTEAWCQTLKHQGGAVLLEQIQALKLPDSAAVREEHRQLCGYLRNNLHRTNYPEYVSRGWQIGSGMIESACKSVVSQRLKGPGMRWREHGTTALCQLRALFKSERTLWDAYWNPPDN